MSDASNSAMPAGEHVEVVRRQDLDEDFAVVASMPNFDQAWQVCEQAGDVLTWKRHGRWTSEWTITAEVLDDAGSRWLYELRKRSA